MSELALFLEKQRQMRELSEELDRLRSNQAVESAMRIKHEIEALLADYDLTPEQLLEALCTLFDLAKPFGYGVQPLLEEKLGEGVDDRKESEAEFPGAQGKRDRREVVTGGQVMVPAKSVTIPSSRRRPKVRSGTGGDAATLVNGEANARPDEKATVKAPGRGRKQRGRRRYTNPHTKEEVVTRGGNHRVLNQWRTEYGADVVDQWWVAEKD